ncbi:MAG: metallophosphoesterase [Planctomycetota bacterium]|nr:metallophosphoesterase [Planctomycetota bacterium]
MPEVASATPSVPPRWRWNRRRFLKWTAGAAGLALAGGAYSLLEAGWFQITRPAWTVPNLPGPFEGLAAAFLADLHHGPWTGLDYVRAAVEAANALEPDLILLGGDYVHRGARFISPCIRELSALRAPLGVYGVLGNHDHWHGAQATRDALKAAGIACLDNQGVWLERGGARLRLGGVGDLWEDRQDLGAALGDARESDAALVLSHNPDFAETVDDGRVGLVLSGHTHGGQVWLPFLGAPVLPSRYGQKYRAGWVRAPATNVYVSRGLGTISPPVRFGCRPELALGRLTAGTA